MRNFEEIGRCFLNSRKLILFDQLGNRFVMWLRQSGESESWKAFKFNHRFLFSLIGSQEKSTTFTNQFFINPFSTFLSVPNVYHPMANPTKYGLAPSPFQWIFPSSLAALCSSLDHPPTVDFSKIDLSLDQDTDRIQISIPLFASSSNPSSSLHSCDLRCLVRLNCPSCTLFDSTTSSTSDHNEPCCRLVLKGIPSLSTNDKSYPTSQVPSAAQYPLSPNARYPLDHHDIHLGKALLGKALLSNIAEEIVDYSMSNGAIVGQSMESIQHVPMTALPSYLPLSLFHQLCALSTDWGILIDRISRNTGFLSASLSSIASVDDFTRHLLDINHTVQTEGLKQQTILHIHRADYMMHASEDED